MLKKIPISSLTLGMHLHALEGPWLEHPFWKTKFIVDDVADLARLASSGVKECWINASLGLDVRQWSTTPAQAAMVVNTSAVEAVDEPRATTHSLNDELRAAAAVCKRGRQAVLTMFQEARMGHAVNAKTCEPLVEEITASVARNPGALISLARLKTKDDYSYMHSVAVCALMVALGRQRGMDDAACRSLGLAGLLHDIGKAVMPPEVLNKAGSLSSAELAIIRTHPQRGQALLLEGQGATVEALDVCLNHHERLDGQGYPNCLEGAAISEQARMGAVCDVYDAITSNRPYKAGWDPAESIARMAGWKGHFDPSIFKAFVCSLGIYPIGSLVRLESGRVAVVVEHHAHAMTAPTVKAFYSTRSKMPITPVLIDLSRPSCVDRITGREAAGDWDPTKTNELWLPYDVAQRAR